MNTIDATRSNSPMLLAMQGGEAATLKGVLKEILGSECLEILRTQGAKSSELITDRDGLTVFSVGKWPSLWTMHCD